MVKATFFALIILALVCVLLFGATTLTNGGIVYKTFATHPDVPPSGALLMWAKTDGTFQVTNSSATDSGMGGGGGSGAGPIVSAWNSAAYSDFSTSSQTAVTFDSHEFDTSSGAMHSTSASTSHFIAPSDGYYAAMCNLIMASGSPFFSNLRLNGTTEVIGSWAGKSTLPTDFSLNRNFAFVHMTAGQYLECMAQPNVTDHPKNGLTSGGANFQLVKLF
jgi:hypothetical protein